MTTANSSSNSFSGFVSLSKRYDVEEMIGYGTFSAVYKGTEKTTGKSVAIKKIRATSSPARTLREIQFLNMLKGKENIVSLLEVHRHAGSVAIVMPFIPQTSFNSFFSTMTLKDIQYYMRELFCALDAAHSLNIIHRDIKPNNILLDHNENYRSLTLIDFGLAQESIVERERKAKKLHTVHVITSGRKSPSRAGTRGFRAPEVLMQISSHSTAIDIWSAGVILLSILSGRYPFFSSPDDLSSLAELGAIFGTTELTEIGQLFGKTVEFPQEFRPMKLESLCKSLHSRDISHIPPCAFDLLSKCLDINPNTRITAKEALQHKFLEKWEGYPTKLLKSNSLAVQVPSTFITNSERAGDIEH